MPDKSFNFYIGYFTGVVSIMITMIILTYSPTLGALVACLIMTAVILVVGRLLAR